MIILWSAPCLLYLCWFSLSCTLWCCAVTGAILNQLYLAYMLFGQISEMHQIADLAKIMVFRQISERLGGPEPLIHNTFKLINTRVRVFKHKKIQNSWEGQQSASKYSPNYSKVPCTGKVHHLLQDLLKLRQIYKNFCFLHKMFPKLSVNSWCYVIFHLLVVGSGCLRGRKLVEI